MNKPVLLASLIVAAAGLGAGLWYWLTISPEPPSAQLVLAPASVSLPSTPPVSTNNGEFLARLYCSTCHLFPEPELLDRKTWVSGALRKMAPWVGAARINFDRHPDGEILRNAHIFPDRPILSEAEWRAINEFYRSNAPAAPLPQKAKEPVRNGLEHFRAKPFYATDRPAMISAVMFDPLQHLVYIGDAGARSLVALRPDGTEAGRVPLASPVVAMTHNPEGYYLTLIGNILPSDQMAGKVVLARNSILDGDWKDVLTKLRRPAHAALADLNQDGISDLVVSQFGNNLGKFSWFEGMAGGGFSEHILLDRPGAIRAQILDVNQDGKPDIIVLMAQGKEGLYIFLNRGSGKFEQVTVVEQHPLFGFSYFEVADFNHDGLLDLLVTNGDNGEYPSPPKNYHGVRIFLNDGQLHFHEAFFYPMNGAYKAVARDFDGDGNLDIAAISFFPDYEARPEESFVYLHNEGGLVFRPFTLPEALAGRWLTMDAADVDGDGDIDILLGSYTAGPESIVLPDSIKQNWQTNHVGVLLLENTRK